MALIGVALDGVDIHPPRRLHEVAASRGMFAQWADVGLAPCPVRGLARRVRGVTITAPCFDTSKLSKSGVAAQASRRLATLFDVLGWGATGCVYVPVAVCATIGVAAPTENTLLAVPSSRATSAATVLFRSAHLGAPISTHPSEPA